MDDYVLYVSGKDFPPDAQSSLAGKRKTARLCHVEVKFLEYIPNIPVLRNE